MTEHTFGNGKKQEVIITAIPRQYHEEAVYHTMFGVGVSPAHWDEVDKLLIWADKGRRHIITAVPGVLDVKVDDELDTKYIVTIDPRYDTVWVTEEIRAQLLIKRPRTRKQSEPIGFFTWSIKCDLPEIDTLGDHVLKAKPKAKPKTKKRGAK